MFKSDWSRRSFLKNSTLLGGYVTTASALSPASALAGIGPATSAIRKSAIGNWVEGSDGLPLFRYTAKPLKQSTVKDFKNPADLLEDDPYFLLGNYRLTTFIHSSGVMRLLTGERSWAKLNEGADQRPDNKAKVVVNGDSIELIGISGLARDPAQCIREFGIGYANFSYQLKALHIRRTLSVAPSTHLHSGISAYLVEIELTNKTQEAQDIVFDESILARYMSSMDRGMTDDQWPVQYTSSTNKKTDLNLVECRFKAQPKDPSRKTSNGQPNRNDLSPPSIFIQAPTELNAGVKIEVYADNDNLGKRLGVRLSATIAPGESMKSRFVVGTKSDAYSDDIKSIIASVNAHKGNTTSVSPFLADWKQRLPDFTKEKNPILRSEMQWNAYVLESMAVHSEFYGETFIPQGMTYDYTMGLTAAPRDHLQHSLPLCYTNPALAKSSIRFVLKKMTYQGEIKYTDIGYGRTSNSAWNTSDQQLYLFLAVSEYLRISDDSNFLEESTEFLPMEAKYSATTLEKLRRALAYLRDEISVGPHGLIRLMNSDWNDMIFMDTPIMKHYWTAESHMNSAMGLCVIPSLIKQLEKSHPKLSSDNQQLCKDLIIGLQLFEQSNRAAFYKDLQKRSFSRRLYLSGGESLGENDMHIEPQIFLMQDEQFPVEKKKILWGEIKQRLLDKEMLEPRQREHGIPGAQYIPGTGENGGSWHALTGPLVIGLASVDKKAASALLERMTFDHFAKCYPEYWVGHWTSPDTINSFESGEIAGLPRNGDNGFWFNFAAYCAHSHAWPLYCYLRLQQNDIVKT